MKSAYTSITLLAAVALTVCCASGCGFYSFSGSALKGIKTVAVPLFENETTEYGLREELTEAITDAVVADNTLRIVNIRGADSALRGVVTRYERECYTFDGSGNCSEYIVRVFVNVVFEELEKNEIIWEEKNIEGYGIYSASDEDIETGKERAIEKLSTDLVDRLIKGW